MGKTVDANGRSILHKGHGMTHTCAPPDVCKTPSPGGPIPIPYVNIAMDSDLADGADSVQIEGNPLANVSAKISTSSGDEAGTAGGGILSSKTKGAVTWKVGSLDVKAEGKMVVRFGDNAFHNGNSFNSAFKNMGGTGLAYADDFQKPCPICSKGPKEHRILETDNSAKLCGDLIRELRSRFDSAAADQKGRFARQKGNKFKGYMVGVMVCPCNKKFAAMSGDNLDGFEEVAKGLGLTPIPGGIATPSELATSNTSAVATAARKLRVIEKRIAEIRPKMKPNAGYNPPGNCAGAKLLARSGHKPKEMTEAFSIVRAEPFKYNVFTTRLASYTGTWLEQILQNRVARKTEETYSGNDSIASCHTCQELLYLTMCPERKCG